MKDKTRTKWIKMIYKDQIKNFFYEEYVSFDNLRRVRTYCMLDDEFKKLIKLDEYGVWSQRLIDELENEGYVSIYTTPYKKLLKK